MSDLLRQKTQLEKDEDVLDELVLAVAAAAHNQVKVLKYAHKTIYDLPTDRLLALLNSSLVRTEKLFTANTTLAVANNQNLAQLNRKEFSERAPETMGRTDIVFDTEVGQWVQLPPLPEEESPAPEEEPPEETPVEEG
ncbi:MAG: hypothetical protein EOP85_00325 [Verrucomicrobiaceae bacterium]|nr:MAG: hypothetical protein EOP85_00325 [Verrucomicrobiaceae bacterium]